MKVLIVAKTRQGSGACVGGITFEGQSVRLIAANAAAQERSGMEYAVGEVWEVDAMPAESVVAPHVENVVVRSKRRLAPMTNPIPFIEKHMPPVDGGPALLYDGLAQAAESGALYITGRAGVPPYSTMFWRPDQPLQRVEDGKRIRYRYPTDDGGRTLVFVGFQEPPETIAAGTLLRVSLAHWWRPDEDEDGEHRCYAQLSGWFLARPDARTFVLRRTVFGANGPASADPVEPAAQPAAPVISPPSAPPSGTKPAPSAQARSTDMNEARHALKTIFGYDDFRPLQADVIANILSGRDTLAVMPTGSGKSLCYQLPALLMDGLTVVVSPLISLMQDQVDQLREVGIPAAFLNSTLEYRDYLETARQVREGAVRLLYTSPETLLRPETLVLLDRGRVACLVIDEAHCISSWGHDFRPEYRQLLEARKRYGSAVCAAFTATATPRVQRDIGQILGFRERDTFVASFNRENLFLEVRPRQSGLPQVLAFLAAHRDQSGIIYCATRKQVDTLAARLAECGWQVVPYHAGLDDATRQRHQFLFSRDKVPIVVATVAFGMGINKSNVRFVLHYNLTENLETYYQEIGRAGRDGLRADCLLLFARADMATIYTFIEQGAESERAGRHARLQAMVRYAEADGCRRALLLDYFGEQQAEPACGFCDNCLSAPTEEARLDATEAARKFLACVQRTGERFGVGHIVDVLRGSKARAVLRWRHDRLPMYGSGTEHAATEWRHLAGQFIRQGLLEQEMEHGTLRLTTRGRAVLAGEKVYVIPARALPALAAETPAYDMALFEHLRRLRRELAEAADVPPYVIFSDKSLVEMATYLPQSPPSFLAVHGVGERKLAQYGDRFLDLIRAYCVERGLPERPRPAGGSSGAGTAIGDRTAEVGRLFAGGLSAAELQDRYGVKQSTIVDHLYWYARSGNPLDAERVRQLSSLSPDRQARVLAALAECGPDRLRPIFDAMEGTIPYDELHILRLYFIVRERP